jgi:hypothetical protein
VLRQELATFVPLGAVRFTAKNDAKFTAKAEKALVRATSGVRELQGRRAHELYKKAKLANAFLWTLKDSGCRRTTRTSSPMAERAPVAMVWLRCPLGRRRRTAPPEAPAPAVSDPPGWKALGNAALGAGNLAEARRCYEQGVLARPADGALRLEPWV